MIVALTLEVRTYLIGWGGISRTLILSLKNKKRFECPKVSPKVPTIPTIFSEKYFAVI